MTAPDKIEAKFWKALRSDMTVFLGCDGAYPRPMTAQVDGDENTGPLWFFTSVETDLGRILSGSNRPGTMTFVSKGHDMWASASGTMTLDNDPEVIDRLWNPFVAAWFEGKDDPKMRLIRFDAKEAELWEDGSSLVAGIKMLMGSDPKEDFQDKTAHVRLDD
ncbi:pyridoxamine 5'-phosphate oxidase family protein [Jannaschia sp. S6380]|uniref:pyridoxamine 5'-phosphate oxidase family protein n=1 Tax=Jannaschia sp. S6380 TaxID=2926408 RepID=UPI001FF543D3|nr:pyridoxamine 5'-phosphate oxidase family protein [Jannaschia sp. S6380]MCK0167910.1 pyridoxamine 5'-phosphate oxidase family protein [Jannaschia sp. S6380]